MNNEGQNQIGHLISHTHWDREWRVPIWNARWRLITMIDSLLDAFEKTELKHFLFDGQVVGIEDYLEFRPEKKEQIKNMVNQGRLQIGPWYNLPDLYPVCGEALVRNLLAGNRHANKLGKCLNIAYTTFGWGQTAQLPQIYKDFGIDFVVVGKNVSKKRAPDSEFVWRSPDGTEILSTRLGVEKRANFFMFATMSIAYGVNYWDKACQIRWGKNGWMWHSADSNVNSEFNCIPIFSYHPEVLKESVADAWNTTDDSLVKKHRFMGNGCDSTGPHHFIDKLIEDANKLSKCKVLKHSSLIEYVKAVEQTIHEGKIELIKIEGELRDGPVHSLSANALASRMYLKDLNRKAQSSLIRYGEPFAALSMMYGIEYPIQFLKRAWHYLLLSHSHDAINGVTLDKTAEDTAYKLKQVAELGQVIMDMSAVNILQKTDLNNYDKDDILIAAFNPTPRPAGHIIKSTIDIPADMSPEMLSVMDSDGKELPTQPIDNSEKIVAVNVQNSRALPMYTHRHNLYLDTGQIPGYGFKILKIKPQGKYDSRIQFWHPQYDFGSQITGPNKMANEHIEVAINPNGTFDLYHKKTSKLYKGLNYFEDSGDIGDYWQRVVPSHDRIYNTIGSNAKIHIAEDGPLVTSFVCEIEFDIPAASNKQTKSRDCDMVSMKIKTQITLKANNPYVEIKTTFTNNAFNHRLRACLPSYIKTDVSNAQGHFNVDTRPINRKFNGNGARDDGMGTVPMQNFVDISDGRSGLAVLNKNLIEYEISEDTSRTIFLTLLRSVPVRICTEHRCATEDSTATGSQCLGKHSLEYAVCPHDDNWQQSDLYNITEQYVYPPRLYQISKHDNGKIPQSTSLLTLSPSNLQISAIKKAEDTDGMTVRFYNPTETIIDAKLQFSCKPKSAYLVNMNEQIKQQLNIQSDGSVTVPAQACKIITLLCNF